MSTENEQIVQRREKLLALQAAGHDPFAIHRFDRSHLAAEAVTAIEAVEAAAGGAEVDWETQEVPVKMAGRLMAIRRQGKSTWADLHDLSGKVQLWAKPDVLANFDDFGELDLGDIIGLEGKAFRTRRGEPTVRLESFVLLAKALRPLPDKWHGLQDVETRYRQRYVDLMVNTDARETFRKRSLAVRGLRNYLDGEHFMEVETPVMQPIYGGAAARPFVTHHNALDMKLYLRIAPELYLKRLLVGGFDRVYEIGRLFRNEGVDTRHNPEFTSVETYEAYADYGDVMRRAEGCICAMAQAANGELKCTYRGNEIDLTPPWTRLSLLDSVKEATGVDFACLSDDAEARAACQDLDLGDLEKENLAGLLDKAFEKFVQPGLIQPTFVIDYPVIISPLAKRLRPDSDITARFEIFMGGEEVGNAFSELNDPLDQRQRFEAQVAMRSRGDAEAHPMDEDFLRALEYGMPPAGGLGIGIDRIIMLLCDKQSLREVILFPHLRREESNPTATETALPPA
ncbi:MAG: lysine--tRNA ligase [Armatimonadia bacterium]